MPGRRVLVSPQGANLLRITSASPLPVGEVTAPYSFTFSATNGTPPYHWSETGSLPAGFTLSSGGVLSGTPGATFSGSFNVTVTDSLTPVASHFTAAFSFTIVAAVSITTTSPLPNATQGSLYSDTMAATGGVTPYSWSLLSQTGSNGWTVSGTGVISGTPSTVETDTLNIQVADALSVVSSANFNLQVVTAGSGAFDFYISTTGSNSNAGTLASPWALTAINAKQSTYAGKRVGVIAGTYDCTTIMNTTQGAALNINGGPNSSTRTYIASCDSSGNYSVGAAILDCKASSGFYGGSNANVSYLMGTTVGGGAGGPTPANWGNWIIDGLNFTGFSEWCVVVGDNSGSGGAVPNVTIQNCSFYDSDMGFVTGSNPNTTHPGPLECYFYTNLLVHNCMFSNNINSSAGANQTHFQGATFWGGLTPGSSRSENGTIEYCTFLKSGGIYGIADTGIISNTTIQYNYFDMTHSTSGPPLPQWVAIFGFGNHNSDNPSTIHHNIGVGGTFIDTGTADQWNSACSIYNNTWDLAGGAGKGGTNPLGFRFFEASGKTGLFTCYNNLMYDNGYAGGMAYGYNVSNIDGFALCDYNIYGTNTTNKFATAPSGGGSATVEYSSLATWAAAIGGLESHSSTNSINPFTNAGALALQYTVTSGPAFQTGRVGGVSGGAAVNVGAWDGIVTQIGSSLPVPP